MSKKNKLQFRTGREGACEAHLYKFEGRANVEGLIDEATHLIAATSLLEAVTYLSKREPDFNIRSVHDMGLIVLISGSPYL